MQVIPENVNIGDVASFWSEEELTEIAIPNGHSVLMYGNLQVEDSIILTKNSSISVVYSGNKQWFCTCVIGKLYMTSFAVVLEQKWYKKAFYYLKNLLRW